MKGKTIRLKGGFKCLVDDEVYQKIKGKRLWVRNRKYVNLYSDKKCVYLHRWILKAKKNMIVDHINGNPLDNRYSNLRIVTHSVNMGNRAKTRSRSGFRCVSELPYTRPRKWHVRIMKDNHAYQRRFFSPFISALVVDAALRQLWEVPGYLNYPFAAPMNTLKQLIQSSMGSWMTIVFSKKSDGRIREMECRIMGMDQVPQPKNWNADHTDLFFVWERDVGIKAIPLERVLCLIVNGLKYHVIRNRSDS